jgi:hypothetical protein
MKTSRKIAASLLAAAAIGALIAGCGPKAESGTHFGEPFTQAPTVTIGELLETPDAFARKTVRVKGMIERQCPAAGCWLIINDGQGRTLKIELGDYHPKLPMNIGHLAEAEGELIKMGDEHEFIGTRVTFSKKRIP